MQSKIVELKLNEIEAVTGGAAYATLSSSNPLQSSFTSAFIKPTFSSPTMWSTSTLSALKLA